MTMTENTEIEALAQAIGRKHKNEVGELTILPAITIDADLRDDMVKVVEELRVLAPQVEALGERMAAYVEWWHQAWRAVDYAEELLPMVERVVPRLELLDLWHRVGSNANAAQDEDRSESALDVGWFRDMRDRERAEFEAMVAERDAALESNADEGSYDGSDD